LSSHPIRRLFERVAGWDYRMNYGAASYGVLIVLERALAEPDAAADTGRM
jgi:hypothetical protein